jgi:hypothetical protein
MSMTEEVLNKIKDNLSNKNFVKYSKFSSVMSKNRVGDIAYCEMDPKNISDMSIVAYTSFSVVVDQTIVNHAVSLEATPLIDNFIYSLHGKIFITFDPFFVPVELLNEFSQKLLFNEKKEVIDQFEKFLLGKAEGAIKTLERNVSDQDKNITKYGSLLHSKISAFKDNDNAIEDFNVWFNDQADKYKKLIISDDADLFQIRPTDLLNGQQTYLGRYVGAKIHKTSYQASLDELWITVANKNIFQSSIDSFESIIKDNACVKHSIVYNYANKDQSSIDFKTIVQLPKPLFNSDADIDFGLLEIIITASVRRGNNQIEYRIKTVAHKNNIFAGGYYHPHVNSNGSMCWGNMNEPVQEAISNNNVAGMYVTTLLVLQHYNASSPYASMSQFIAAAEGTEYDYENEEDEDEDEDE